MSEQCTRCGSYAINMQQHGRKEGVDPDLCDVCYWRIRAESARERMLAKARLYQSDDGQPGPLGLVWGWHTIAEHLRKIAEGMGEGER